MRDQLHVCHDAAALAHHARNWLVRLLEQHFAQSEKPFSLALSGGSTPRRLYSLLAELPAGSIDWKRLWLLWGDERNVPPDDESSNFRMVRESLLDHIPIPPENILAVPQPGGEPVAAAQAYEDLLRTRLPAAKNGLPQIDCVLLGLGDDVHTASLFPGTAALGEQRRWVVANEVPQLDCWRITLTAPAINAAQHVVLLVSGDNKQAAMDKLWHASPDPEKYPAQLIRPNPGQLWYLLDKPALGSTPLPEFLIAQII
ncbi:MAG: 6-phosphogluconolactonase [Planctomycetales bacterium]|nr:6-phosphogluconolactonase [Planctomycetales bacterium]